MFTVIFLSLFLVAWLLLGFAVWLTVSVATRGNAGLGMLPLCLVAGIVAGLAVPLLGKDDDAGIWWSMAAAVVVPAMLMAARRLALPARDSKTSPTAAPK